jgi:RNA polymerase sigma factor (sigma-70 family)
MASRPTTRRNLQPTTPIFPPLFSPGTENLFRANPPLEPSRTRALAAEFAAAQAEVCARLAALAYPLQRLMQEMRAGHLSPFREGSDQDRKVGCRKASYRFAGFTPTHQEEFDRETLALEEGRLPRSEFTARESAFLLRFTFEVLEQVALRALPAPAHAPEATDSLRRDLTAALAVARGLRDTILRGNLLLVAQIAIRRSRAHPAFSLDELFAAGTDGLLIAVNRYDPQVAQFSTYATPWISMAIDRFGANNRHTIRIPIGLQDKARRQGGEAASLIPQVQSLEEPLPDSDGEMRLEDVVPDPSAQQPIEAVERSDTARLLEDGVRQLSPLKQLIIALRSEVGDALSLARGRATAAAAAQTRDEPARLRLLEPAASPPVPAPTDPVRLAVAV